MQEINLILSDNPSFKFVQVRFPHENGGSSKPYTYKTHINLEVNDFVIVQSPYGVKVVQVSKLLSIHEADSNYRYKWVVQKVDYTDYNYLNENEEHILGTLATIRAKKLKKEMYKELTKEIGKKAIAEFRKLIG